MKTYEFTVVASGLDPAADDFEARFFDAGCDDATVSFQRGHVLVDFARDAEDVCDAFASAVDAVERAGATVDRIEPDPLVSLADIASRSGLSRAAMTQYSKGQRSSDFPAPVAKVTSASPLWEWSSVCRWLYDARKVERDVVVHAEAVRVANSIIAGDGDFRTRLCQEVKKFDAVLA